MSSLGGTAARARPLAAILWRVGLLAITGLFGPLSLVGCESKLPGPLECETMTRTWMSRSERELAASPAARRIAEHVVQACLTTPFDHQAVRCMEESRNLLMCMDDLARREPTRAESIRLFLQAINRH